MFVQLSDIDQASGALFMWCSGSSHSGFVSSEICHNVPILDNLFGLVIDQDHFSLLFDDLLEQQTRTSISFPYTI